MVLSIRIAVSKSLCFRINSVHKNVSFWTCIFLWNYMCSWVLFASVQFSHSVLSNSVTSWTTARQASLSISTPGIYSNSCPLSWWCHPTISSSVVPFSSSPQSLWASGSFQMSQLLAWGGQSIGVSASASVPPMNTQDWSPLGWTGFICLVNSLKVLRSKSCLSCVRILRYDRKSYSFHWYWLVKIYPIPRLLV